MSLNTAPARRWATAVGFALVPVIFTAAGAATAQILRLDDRAALLLLAAAAALSAAVGLIVLRRRIGSTRPGGLGRPRRLRAALWLLPALGAVLAIVATQPPTAPSTHWLAYGALVGAVAVNEEVWFRGVVLDVLRGFGIRTSIAGSAALFAILHLANAAGGAEVSALALQLGFAAVFGIVAAQLTVLTGSLWPAIVWHALWNLANFLGGNLVTPVAMLGIGVAIVVLIMYALVLSRRLRSSVAASTWR